MSPTRCQRSGVRPPAEDWNCGWGRACRIGCMRSGVRPRAEIGTLPDNVDLEHGRGGRGFVPRPRIGTTEIVVPTARTLIERSGVRPPAEDWNSAAPVLNDGHVWAVGGSSPGRGLEPHKRRVIASTALRSGVRPPAEDWNISLMVSRRSAVGRSGVRPRAEDWNCWSMAAPSQPPLRSGVRPPAEDWNQPLRAARGTRRRAVGGSSPGRGLEPESGDRG